MNRLVICYGTLKRNHSNNPCLGSSEFLGEHWVPGFNLHSCGYYPAAAPGQGKIKGEVFRITDEHTSKRVNHLEGFISRGNPDNYYDTVDVPTPWGVAEMFFIKSHKGPIVESGVWK